MPIKDSLYVPPVHQFAQIKKKTYFLTHLSWYLAMQVDYFVQVLTYTSLRLLILLKYNVCNGTTLNSV